MGIVIDRILART